MSLSYHCNYWEVRKDGSVSDLIHDPCFARIYFSQLLEVRYLAKLGSMSDEEALYYIEFAKYVLGEDGQFDARLVVEQGERCILWTLRLYNDNHYKNLLYLTFFRYPDEHKKVAKALYTLRNQRMSKVWKEFYEMHYQMYHAEGKWFKTLGRGLGCHVLINGYSSICSKTAISVKKFRKNLKDTRKSVFAYFSKE